MPSPRSPRRRWPWPAAARAQARVRRRRRAAAPLKRGRGAVVEQLGRLDRVRLGGQGAQSVTNYLSYVGGKAGPANRSLPPVYHRLRQRAGRRRRPSACWPPRARRWRSTTSTPSSAASTATRSSSTPASSRPPRKQGTTCAQKFLANNKIDVIATGGVAIGVAVVLSTLNGAKAGDRRRGGDPVRRGAKNTVILFGDITHVLGADRHLRQGRAARQDRGGRSTRRDNAGHRRRRRGGRGGTQGGRGHRQVASATRRARPT